MSKREWTPGSEPSSIEEQAAATAEGASLTSEFERDGRAFGDGELVAGRFEIIRLIAFGGLGEVYEAVNRELDERVALKVLQRARSQDQQTVERFKREISLARRVTHPNVCRILDAGIHAPGSTDSVFYLTMELLEGVTLDQLIAERGPMDDSTVLDVARQMISALSAAHQVGVVHRDFKSANVIIENDRVVITDFGLARAVRSDENQFETSVGSVVGTPSFMAPEQIEGGEVSFGADVYALGVVLFELLAGRLPFRGDSPFLVVSRKLREEAPRLRSINPEVSDLWDDVVARCLERNPLERFHTVEEVGRALSGAEDQGGESVQIERKNRVTSRSLLGLLALLPIGALLWLWTREQPDVSQARPMIQLTTEQGLEIDPSFSPDGQAVVYSAAGIEGSFEIFIEQLVSGTRRRAVTADGKSNVQPDWSPDGHTIAYTSRDRGGIWTISSLGGQPTKVTEFGSRPRWHPDGQSLVFQQDERWEVAARASAASPPSILWSVEPGGEAPVSLTRIGSPPGGHGEPRYSSDGELIAFSVGDRRKSELWMLEVETGTHWPLVTGWRFAGSPAFTADARALIFTGIPPASVEAATISLWKLPLDRRGMPDGQPVAEIRLGSATIRTAAVAPTGDRTVFGALTTSSNLWAVRAGNDRAGDQQPWPLTTGNGRNNRPSFSPDGQWLAFDRWNIGRNLDIYALDLDDPESVPRQLTSDPGRDSQPSWTADGRGVLAASDRGDLPQLWETSLEDGSGRSFLTLEAGADWVRVAPNGQAIVFNMPDRDGQTRLRYQRIGDEASSLLGNEEQMLGFGTWSQSGELVAAEMRSKDGSSQVASIRIEDGKVEVLTTGAGKRWPYGWSPDDDEIVFAGFQDRQWNIQSVSRETGEVRALTNLEGPGRYVRYPAWSPRGDFVVYELAETEGDLWLLEQPSR